MKLDAKARLKAWALNNLPEKRSWSKWVSLDLFPDPKDLITGIVGLSLGNLNGYTIFHVPARSAYYLVDEFAQQLVLVFEYDKIRTHTRETLIAVNPKYHGQGLAFFFYEWLLKQVHEIESDWSLSKGAAKLWMRLIERHRGFLRVQDTSTSTPVDVAIHGFQEYKGVWWPLVERDGQIVLLPRINPENAKERQALKYCRYVVRL